MKTYEEALDYLYNQLPMFQRIGNAAIKKDLTNIRKLLDKLDNPQQQYPSIHIAGTNGKGSVTHLLGSLLMVQGIRTGFYTSPHYIDFRERFKVDGLLPPKQFLVDFLNAHQTYIGEIKPSFFEWSVAMAFELFRQEKVQMAVVETGLGGLLDSTNILLPEIAIITNISYDHQEFLGDTLPEIALQKAGIIKPHTPVVIGEYHEATWPVFVEVAKEKNAPLHLAADRVKVTVLEDRLDGMRLQVDFLHLDLSFEAETDLTGPYQWKNIQTALAAWEILSWYQEELELEPALLQQGLSDIRQRTYFLGRWQVLQTDPLVLIDSGHNPGGFETIIRKINEFQTQGDLHIVLGLTAEKAVDEMLAMLPRDAHYYFSKADIPKGLNAKILQEKAKEKGLIGEPYPSVVEAYLAALSQAQPTDVVFVGGSIYVLGELLAHLQG